MSKKKEISKQDLTLFQEAMRGVKPIKSTKTPYTSKPNPVSKKQARNFNNDIELEQDLFSDFETLTPVNSNDIINFSRPGISNKTLRNLRNGKYNVEATLDLHGLIVEEARKTLSHFLRKCHEQDIRFILIIHGKGHAQKPTLKNKLNHWLRQTDQVLAFHSAMRHGPSGALYVLLKQLPRNDNLQAKKIIAKHKK